MDYGDWDDDGGFAPAGAMLGAPAMAEDAHLEAAFEDRISGDMGYEPEALDADFGGYEPYEPGPYTGDDPGDDGDW